MIRAARPGDAIHLAGLERRAWLRAWSERADPDRLASLEERRERWDELLEHPDRTLVFEVADVVAGFASVGPARDPGLDARTGELMALYVDPPAQGAGVGGALHDAALDRLRGDGLRTAVLWVFADSEHARHVYEQRGWTQDAGVLREELWAPELRYRRAL